MLKYKLLIVRNRTNEKFNPKVGLDWFKKNTPIEIVTEELITDFDVTTRPISNGVWTGVVCGEDIYAKLRTVIPEGKYHGVMFLYGNNLNGVRVSVTESTPLYPDTEVSQICTLNDSGLTCNHELMHQFFFKLKRQNIPVEDCMDFVVVNGVMMKYYNNNLLDAKISNRTIALERLKPHWDKVVGMSTITPKKYKYFTQKEVDTFKLKPELWVKLDELREKCGFPFAITSGLRSKAQNDILKDSVSDSAHLLGLAVDISCTDSIKRFKMIQVGLESGIRRIGVGKNFIHYDIATDKPQNVCWHYYD